MQTARLIITTLIGFFALFMAYLCGRQAYMLPKGNELLLPWILGAAICGCCGIIVLLYVNDEIEKKW